MAEQTFMRVGFTPSDGEQELAIRTTRQPQTREAFQAAIERYDATKEVPDGFQVYDPRMVSQGRHVFDVVNDPIQKDAPTKLGIAAMLASIAPGLALRAVGLGGITGMANTASGDPA